MEGERQKKRSHDEVVAAREQYLKEREERQKARAERRAEREKVAAERQARKERREKLKSMSEAERSQARYELQLEKAQKMARKEEGVHPLVRIKPYGGDLQIGTFYTIRFAGSLIYGKYIGESLAGDDEGGGMKRRYSLYVFESKQIFDGRTGQYWKYPIAREDVLCEGVLTPEKCEGLMSPTFNGISYYA